MIAYAKHKVSVKENYTIIKNNISILIYADYIYKESAHISNITEIVRITVIYCNKSKWLTVYTKQ